MRTRIQKWGNSLALRIPRALAEAAGLTQDSPVELRVIDGQLVVTSTAAHYHLADLLAQITDENRHDEVDSGEPTGNEVW